MSSKKAIVIGSGIGGLAIAIRLSLKGYKVTVFETNSYVGGKVSWIEKDGFKWGFGASLLTLPELIDDLFTLAGKNPNDYYEYIQLNPITQYFYPDGTCINAYADREQFAAEIENKTSDKKETVLKYLDNIRYLFDLTEKTFLHSSLHKVKTYLSLKAAKIALISPFKLGLFSTVNKKLTKIFKDPKTIQLFNRYATYNGSDPFRAPAVLNIIAHPEFNKGAFILKDGMPSLTQNMHKLALELGVEFKLNHRVEKIIIEENKAKGVESNNQDFAADLIVSNMDVYFTYKKLIPQIKPPKKHIEQERSTSTLIYYWGMKKKFDKLHVHNILFSANYQKEFESLSNGEIFDDPTIYIFISSKINSSHAPENSENWFILINAPYNTNQEWEALNTKFRKIAIDKISKVLEENIEPFIVSEEFNTPTSIEAKTSSFAGALYGISTNSMMSTFHRHPNFSSKIKNLYFCGGSTHPGGGVPICLLSAKITDELIK